MEIRKRIINFVAKHRYKTIVLVVCAIGLLYYVTNSQTEPTSVNETVLPVVTVATVNQLRGPEDISVIGTVRARSEAEVTAETGGRITTVQAKLGQVVPAGFVLATIENASEQAAVLQAEGAYESALAAGQQSGVSLTEATTALVRAQDTVVNAYQSAYTTVNGAIRNEIDAFFSNPNGMLPGLRISGQGSTAFLNSERVAFQTILPEWQTKAVTLTTDSDLVAAGNEAIDLIDRTIRMTDTFLTLFNTQNRDDSYLEEELRAFSADFTTLRSTLQSARLRVVNDIADLETAEDAVQKASIGATGSRSSIADAQIKQALGTLRAAQANLEKTILRTPISGTVNTLNVRIGDFVATQETIARVANNEALEIITFVSDSERAALEPGATVTVDTQYEGVVTQVSESVDPITKKTEVRIAAEAPELTNGDTVTISRQYAATQPDSQSLFVPLSAIKFEIEDGYIFQVLDGRLIKKPVTLGIIRGGSIEILSGLTATDEFVLDARGLLEDSQVEVRRN